VDHEGREHDDPPPATVRGRGQGQGLKTAVQFIPVARAECAPLRRGSMRHLGVLQPAAHSGALQALIDTGPLAGERRTRLTRAHGATVRPRSAGHAPLRSRQAALYTQPPYSKALHEKLSYQKTATPLHAIPAFITVHKTARLQRAVPLAKPKCLASI
jgi:hypothetical protein